MHVSSLCELVKSFHFQTFFGWFNWSFCVVHIPCAKFGSHMLPLLGHPPQHLEGHFLPDHGYLETGCSSHADHEARASQNCTSTPRVQWFGKGAPQVGQPSTRCEPWLNTCVRFTDLPGCSSTNKNIIIIFIIIYIYNIFIYIYIWYAYIIYNI